MQFPTIFEWLDQFQFLRGMPAAYAAFALALIIFFVPDWRVSLLALLVHYLVAGLLFVDVLEPRLAFVKVIVGLFICLILYVTGRQVQWRPAAQPDAADPLQRRLASFLFRLFLAVVLLLIGLYARQQPLLPGLAAAPVHLTLAVYLVAGTGILTMMMTNDPLRAGMGVLLLMTGFELFYNSIEGALAILLALAAINFAIALAAAFLTQARYGLIPFTSR